MQNSTDMRRENENPLPDDDDADDNMLSHMMIGSLEPAHDDHVRIDKATATTGWVRLAMAVRPRNDAQRSNGDT